MICSLPVSFVFNILIYKLKLVLQGVIDWRRLFRIFVYIPIESAYLKVFWNIPESIFGIINNFLLKFAKHFEGLEKDVSELSPSGGVLLFVFFVIVFLIEYKLDHTDVAYVTTRVGRD